MIDSERMTQTVLDLVKIDSHSREEQEVAAYVARALSDAGCQVRLDDAGAKVGGNSGNVIGRLPGTKADAPPLLLSAHMDTVGPGKGVKPIREGDRIRSDGTTILGGDDKTGLAIIIEALRTLRDKGIPHGDVEVAFTICEEIGLLGAKHLDVSGFRAQTGIVLDATEGTALYTQAPSSDRFTFTVHGLEAHAGIAPENGISAVRVAAEAIAAIPLGRVDQQTTSNVIVVEGGVATNVVPNTCVVRGESRSHDDGRLDATTSAIRRAFQDAASRATAMVNGKLHRAWVEERCDREYDRMAIADDAAVVALVMRAAQAVGRNVRTARIGGGSDANVFNRRGIQTVNLGSGMRDIHTVNEWIDLEDFYGSARVIVECLRLNAA